MARATSNEKKTTKSRARAADKERDFTANGKFKAGNKCGGRKKIPDDIKQMLAAATPDACKLLCETLNNERVNIKIRIHVAEIILDRVHGKAKQQVDVDATNIPQVVFVGGDKIAD